MNSKGLWISSRSSIRVLVIMVVSLLLAASAVAQTVVFNVSTNVAPSSMFRPRGAVRIQVGAAGPDYWVGDGASGFCRLDNGVLNIGTCFLNGTSEPYDDRPNSPYVFVADNSGGGVHRFTFGVDPRDPTRTAIATVEQVLGKDVGILVPGTLPGKIRTESAKIGPDGNLYVVFQGNGNIVRITNPRNPLPPSPLIQKVSIIGTSDNQKRLVSMAWLGNDLWVVQAGFLERIQNATACKRITPACTAVLQFGNIQFPMGLASDPTDASQRYLYFDNGGQIARLDTFASALRPGTPALVVWSSRGLLNGTPVAYSLPRGVNIHPPGANGPGDPGGDIIITDDITIEAILPEVAAPKVRSGRAWVLKPAPTSELCASGLGPVPCTITSPVGIGTPPLPSPTQAIAATRAVLRATGVTHVRGMVFLGTHFWVSDEDQGFCRLDAVAFGVASLTNCFKGINGQPFTPGQPAAQTTINALTKLPVTNVYVPDISGSSRGVLRFVFDPGTETISQSGVLSQGRGSTAAAVAIGPEKPEGSLYMGPVGSGRVTKIVTPASAASAAIDVAATAQGLGVRSMFFNGFDLYMAENGLSNADTIFSNSTGLQTFILHAAPDLGRGHADFFSGLPAFITPPRRTPAPTDIDTPIAVTVGPTGVSACNTPVFTEPTTLPSLYLGGAAAVNQWSFLCTRYTLWTDQGQLTPLADLNAQLGTVTALAFAPDGTLAIADDPFIDASSPTVPPQTTQHGQGHIYVVLSQ